MNSNPVDLRPVLREGVDASLKAAPVILVAPVGNERLSLLKRDALRPVADRFPLRPASPCKSPLEIVERGLRYTNLERCHGLCRCRQHGFRNLCGAFPG